MLTPLFAERALACAPEALVICEGSGVIAFANRAADALFGYRDGEVLGLPIERLVPTGVQGRLANATADTYACRKDGTEFPVQVRTATLTGPGEEHVLASIQDLTERKRITAELVVSREIARRECQDRIRFLETASLDLRDSLETLRQVNEDLHRVTVDPPSAAALIRQDRALAALEDMADTLIGISKLDLGGIRPLPSRFRILPLLEGLQRVLQPLAARARIGLEIEVDSAEAVAHTDAELIEQALRHLISAAIQYTPRGRVLVRCVSGPDVLRLELSDTGIGIPPEHLTRDRYSLGLGFVTRIVKLLQLTLESHSAPGHGSTFRLTMPGGRMSL